MARQVFLDKGISRDNGTITAEAVVVLMDQSTHRPIGQFLGKVGSPDPASRPTTAKGQIGRIAIARGIKGIGHKTHLDQLTLKAACVPDRGRTPNFNVVDLVISDRAQVKIAAANVVLVVVAEVIGRTIQIIPVTRCPVRAAMSELTTHLFNQRPGFRDTVDALLFVDPPKRLDENGGELHQSQGVISGNADRHQIVRRMKPDLLNTAIGRTGMAVNPVNLDRLGVNLGKGVSCVEEQIPNALSPKFTLDSHTTKLSATTAIGHDGSRTNNLVVYHEKERENFCLQHSLGQNINVQNFLDGKILAVNPQKQAFDGLGFDDVLLGLAFSSDASQTLLRQILVWENQIGRESTVKLLHGASS